MTPAFTSLSNVGWQLAIDGKFAAMGPREGDGDANGRRIAAAWNAVEGIPVEALEAGAVRRLIAACRLYVQSVDGSYAQVMYAIGEAKSVLSELGDNP